MRMGTRMRMGALVAVRVRTRGLRHWAGAGLGAALALSPLTTGSASAASTAAEPAPSCVSMYESWRYTQAANGCGTALTLKVVYQDGAEGLCHTVSDGNVTTIGEGYLGSHGHARHIALCV
ncbi:hypothetical protein [Streptomyces sp.]|uniref:hypothetical protein n=1 Tax=Streptomyces sp. TaxID=1931 RepID=UPI002D2420DB|nr:hypothetical protein [Streptomyces sp.]HZF89088.1 hypothetical protein [Streptomyces sp.]